MGPNCSPQLPQSTRGNENSKQLFRTSPSIIFSDTSKVHLPHRKCTEPWLNSLWHCTKGFYRLLLRNQLEAVGPSSIPTPTSTPLKLSLLLRCSPNVPFIATDVICCRSPFYTTDAATKTIIPLGRRAERKPKLFQIFLKS